MKPNYIIRLLVLLLFMVTGQKAFSQWAGPDQEILRNDNNTQTVTLSVVDYDPQACYNWSGPNIQGNPPQPTGPTVTVNPQNETQTYICTRTSYMGVEQDAVVIKVYNHIKIVKVIPQKTCYIPDDNILIDDFDIKTQPEGFESQVLLTPTKMPLRASGSNLQGRYDVNVEFFIPHHDSVTIQVPCINSDASFHQDYGVGEVASFFRGVDNLRDHISRAIDVHVAFGDFSPDTHNEWEWSTPTIGMHWDCCNDNIQRMAHIKWDGFRYNLSAEVYTPPFLFGAVYASFSASFAISLAQFEGDVSFDLNCAKATLGIGISASVSGNLGIAALNPRLLSVQGGIEGSVSATGNLVIPDFTLSGDAKLECAIVGRVTAVSLTIWQGRKVIGVFPIHL